MGRSVPSPLALLLALGDFGSCRYPQRAMSSMYRQFLPLRTSHSVTKARPNPVLFQNTPPPYNSPVGPPRPVSTSPPDTAKP